jgi:hypothetical protein
MSARDLICLCEWSSVNTATIVPPYPVKRNPDCPAHGVCPECRTWREEGMCLCKDEEEEA